MTVWEAWGSKRTWSVMAAGLLVFVLFVLAGGRAAAGLLVAPARVQAEWRPGMEPVLTIRNTGNEEFAVQVSVKEASHTPEGIPVAGDEQRREGAWLEPVPKRFRCGPGQTGRVRLRLRGVEGLRGGIYRLVVVSAEKIGGAPSVSGTTGVQVPVLLTGDGGRPQLGLGEAWAEALPGGAAALTAMVRNDGDIHICPDVIFLVRSGRQVIKRIAARPGTILPGCQRRFRAVFHPPGAADLDVAVQVFGRGAKQPLAAPLGRIRTGPDGEVLPMRVTIEGLSYDPQARLVEVKLVNRGGFSLSGELVLENATTGEELASYPVSDVHPGESLVLTGRLPGAYPYAEQLRAFFRARGDELAAARLSLDGHLRQAVATGR